MRTQSQALILSGMMLLLCFSVARALDRSDITFYAGFEDTLTASIAPGDKEPQGPRNCRFAEGISGKGVVVTADRLTYGFDKSIHAREATFSVWVKPLDWGSGDIQTGQYNFVMFNADPMMQVTTVYYGVTRFYLYRQDGQGSAIAEYGAFWEKGRWRHLAVTWKSGREIQFFIDGVSLGRISEGVLPVNSVPSFSIGAPNTVFDELLIFKRALRHEEVRALFYGLKASRYGRTTKETDRSHEVYADI